MHDDLQIRQRGKVRSVAICLTSSFWMKSFASSEMSMPASVPKCQGSCALKMLSNTFSGVSPVNGGRPNINSNIMTPRAHQSTAWLCSCPNKISGLRYSGVPTTSSRFRIRDEPASAVIVLINSDVVGVLPKSPELRNDALVLVSVVEGCESGAFGTVSLEPV